jgi:hypothetical protein
MNPATASHANVVGVRSNTTDALVRLPRFSPLNFKAEIFSAKVSDNENIKVLLQYALKPKP